jgi:hypothetical protein
MPHYSTPLIWRLEKKAAGLGALGNLGAHIIDFSRKSTASRATSASTWNA